MDSATSSEFLQKDGVDGWRVVDSAASAWFAAPSLTAGAELVSRIADLTDGNIAADIDLRASGVRVRIGGPSRAATTADATLARAVSAAAHDLGLTPDPSALQTVRVAIDAIDEPSVMSFWRAVSSYLPIGGDVLGDPLRRDSAILFHRRNDPRPLRNRIHLDVVRLPESVQAAKDAIGTDAYGAYQLTLADAEGNEVDLVPGDRLSEGQEASDWWALFGAMSFYPTESPWQASRLAAAVAALADEAGVPILVDLRPDGVTVDSGKDQWEVDDRFGELAARIQTAAHDLDLSADPARLRFVQLGIDAVDVSAVRAFWTSVLGYRHDPRENLTDIYDPRRLNPVVIFQQMDASECERRRQRNRIRLDIALPHDVVEQRVAAVIEAGGRLVSDQRAPSSWLVADPEGNEATLRS